MIPMPHGDFCICVCSWVRRLLRLYLGSLVPVSFWLTMAYQLLACHDLVHYLFAKLGIEGSLVYHLSQ